jgi:hypothetical protein
MIEAGMILEWVLSIAVTAAVALAFLIARRYMQAADFGEYGVLVQALVRAAEKALDGSDGHEKYDFVLKEAKRLAPRLDVDLLRVLIEKEVYEMELEEAIAMPVVVLPEYVEHAEGE